MSLTVQNRVSLKLNCPNPLFEKCLTEWKEQAKAKNSKTYHTYCLALQSLRKYPLPLEKGKDCKILKGFGNKLCEMLDNELKKSKAGVEQGISEPKQQKKRTNSRSEYVPTYKSGPYALITALYKNFQEGDEDFLLKEDLIKAAQPYCDTSFTKPDPGSFYTAWSSMRTLVTKNLVKKEGKPTKFSLTNEGLALGRNLHSHSVSTNDAEIPILRSNSIEISEPICVKEQVPVNLYETQAIKSVGEPSVELKKICGTFSNENKESIQGISNYQDVILAPHSFNIILCVDAQETCGSQTDPKDDPILAELQKCDVNYEVKNLKVGDYCWICRSTESSVELVTPYIIERKRMDDLAGSIKDGRFHEQKFRLKQCGLRNVIYMIESYGKKDEHLGLPLNSLHQAAINTLIQDSFCVKFVEGIRGVAEYLACMTNIIKRSYENKTIVSCPKENLSDISIHDDLVSLMIFSEFNKLSTKAKNFTVKEMFIRQLLQIKGLSVDKALAIIEVYQTPQLLEKSLLESGTKSLNDIANIKYGKLGKKIGYVLSNIIYQLFTRSAF